MTHEQMIERLKFETEQESRSAVAKRYGFSLSYVSNILEGRSPISARMAQAMGFRRVVRFERVDG